MNHKKLKFYSLCSNEDEIYSYNLATINIKDFNYPIQEDLNKNYNNIG